MTIKLHCFGESGNAYKATLALELAGLDWEVVKVNFFAGAARTDEFRQQNVMAEAPVLVDGDFTLSQSGAIQQTSLIKRENSVVSWMRNTKFCAGFCGTTTSSAHRLA